MEAFERISLNVYILVKVKVPNRAKVLELVDEAKVVGVVKGCVR